ncbi:MAG: MEDS domain-containing protein [Acidobacteriota bacterium]
MSTRVEKESHGPLSKDNSTGIFWGEIAPCQHVAQIYANDDALLNNLTPFIAEGLRLGEAAIVIATPAHVADLQKRLMAMDVDLTAAVLDDLLLTVDAETILSQFMLKQWPVEELFFALIGDLLKRAGAERRKVRAFGEMVALLWERGDTAATVHLEYMWEDLRRRHPVTLFCAYPKAGMTKVPEESMAEICAAHARVFC